MFARYTADVNQVNSLCHTYFSYLGCERQSFTSIQNSRQGYTPLYILVFTVLETDIVKIRIIWSPLYVRCKFHETAGELHISRTCRQRILGNHCQTEKFWIFGNKNLTKKSRVCISYSFFSYNIQSFPGQRYCKRTQLPVHPVAMLHAFRTDDQRKSLDWIGLDWMEEINFVTVHLTEKRGQWRKRERCTVS